MENPFRYFKTSPEVIRLTVMMYVRFWLRLLKNSETGVCVEIYCPLGHAMHSGYEGTGQKR